MASVSAAGAADIEGSKAGEDEEASPTESVKAATLAQKRGQNFKQAMATAYKENQLHNVLRFTTDYLRQVIENGSRFTSGHFFIMLLQLSASEVKNQFGPFCRILVEELGVPQDQYQRFIAGLKEQKLSDAFDMIQDDVYGDLQ